MAELSSARILRGKAHAKGVAAGKLVETVNSLTAEDFFRKYFCVEARSQLVEQAKLAGLEMILRDAGTLETHCLDRCMGLIEQSSRDDYAKSEMNWRPAAKRKEMLLPDMKYVILGRGGQGNPTTEVLLDVLGFISFMITYEDGHEVVYIYEIHLSPSVQGKGMGKALMRVIEDLGRQVKVSKVMLTVFRSNKHANQWYERQGYGVDEFSPGPKMLRNGAVKQPSYLILSKNLK